MFNSILLKFPTYKTYKFPLKNARYYNQNSDSKNFFNDMKNLYEGYCPYCGEKLTNRAAIAEKEHTIERRQYLNLEAEYIKHCKFNLCIACSTCNKLKSKNIVPINISYFKEDIFEDKCLRKECSLPCHKIYNALNEYLNLNKIIVQPFGVKGKPSNSLYEISYEVETREFIPYNNPNFSEYDKNKINAHIKKFKLNINKSDGISLEFIKDLIFEIENYQIDEKYIQQKNYTFKNILQKIFLEHLSTLNKKQQKIKLYLLKKEYEKFEME